ncbi:hypothetical protein EDC96DRAFT_67721, partial [Choanephora cucurbitarum]
PCLKHYQAIKQSFPHLKSIALHVCNHHGCFNEIDSDTRDSNSKFRTIMDLFFPNHLKRLAIHIDYCMRFDVGLLEHICAACPLLEHLSIECSTSQVGEFRDQKRVIASKIKVLELRVYVHEWNASEWLWHVGESYPNLQTLRICCVLNNRWAVPVTCAVKYDRIPLYSRLFSQCRSLTLLETENLMFDTEFLRQLKHKTTSQKKRLRFNCRFTTGNLSRSFLELCKHDLDVFSVINQLDMGCLYNPNSQKPIEFLGKACSQLTRLILGPHDQRKTNSLWLDQVLDCFPCLTYLEVAQLRLLDKPKGAIRRTHTRHALLQLKIKDCTLLGGCLDGLAARCLDLKHLDLNGPRFEYRYGQAYINLHQQELRTLHIRHPRVSDLDQVIQTFRLQVSETTRWYYMQEYKRHTKTLLEIAKTIEQLNTTDTLLLDTILDQHPSAWMDLTMQAHMHPSDLLRGTQLATAVSAGYVGIMCHSVKAFWINDRHVF